MFSSYSRNILAGSGAALSGEISAYHEIVLKLDREYGRKESLDWLSDRIDSMFDEFIAIMERFGGSVISLIGDSVICWFDADDGKNAVGSSLQLQRAARKHRRRRPRRRR